MTFDNADFVYGLDGEHIRKVCLTATRDTNADYAVSDTINVTAVGAPSRVYVAADDKPMTALHALRRVGYDAESENRHSITVRGWSTDRLTARIDSLTAARYRLDSKLSDAATRAISHYAIDALDSPSDSVQRAARNAARQVGDLLRHEITTLTGPHIPHDPHIRPPGPAFDLVTRAGELEEAIARQIGRIEYVATRAIERYVGYLTSPVPPNVPGHKAVRNALRDLRRQEATTPRTEHPVAVAAADHPGDDRTTASATIPGRTPEPAQPQQTRGPSVHRGAS